MFDDVRVPLIVGVLTLFLLFFCAGYMLAEYQLPDCTAPCCVKGEM